MARYRKRPVVIEAEQWFPGKQVKGVMEMVLPQYILNTNPPSYAIVRTLEGDMRVEPGDYIITGVKGEKYPCKPDIFEMTYEPVAAAPHPLAVGMPVVWE